MESWSEVTAVPVGGGFACVGWAWTLGVGALPVCNPVGGYSAGPGLVGAF